MTAKYQLTINTDNAADIAAVIAALNSSTVAITPSNGVTLSASGQTVALPTGPATTEDDDENNDTQADATGVDKNGLPWDDRIHSTPAKMTKKGEWRAKRNVDDNFVKQVEAELRARGQQQQPVQTQPVMQQSQQFQQPVQTQPVMQQPQQFQQPQFDPNAQQQPVQQYQQPMQQPQQFQQPVQTQPVMQQPQQFQQLPPVPADFQGFMTKIQQLLQHRDAAGNPWIDAGYLQGLSAQLGVAAITDLMTNPAKISDAVSLMTQHGKWV